MKTSIARIKLDWSKLMGFNQVPPGSQRVKEMVGQKSNRANPMAGQKVMAGVKAFHPHS